MYKMELNAQETRGEKKLAIKKLAEFKEESTTLKWIAKQATWAEDIKAFEEATKPKETKSKKEK